MRTITYIYLALCFNLCHAQYPLIGCDASGKNSAVTALNSGYGQSSFLQLDSSGIAIGFQMPYTGSAIYHLQFAVVVSPKFGSYAVSFNSFKSAGSFQNNYNIILGERFWDKLGITLGLNLGHQIYLDRYDDKFIFMVDAGLSYNFSENLYVAGYFKNINVASYVDSRESVPPGFDLRFGWRKPQKFDFTLGVDGDFYQIPCAYVGFKYSLHKLVALDVGMQSYPFGAGLGIVFQSKFIQIALGSRYAIQRGLTPFSSASYVW